MPGPPGRRRGPGRARPRPTRRGEPGGRGARARPRPPGRAPRRAPPAPPRSRPPPRAARLSAPGGARVSAPLFPPGDPPRRLCPPVTLDPLAIAFGDEHVPGWKLVDRTQSGPFAGHVLQREISIERLQVDVSRDLREAQQRLQLRRKRERPVGKPGPEERLLAEPVARQHEPLAG